MPITRIKSITMIIANHHDLWNLGYFDTVEQKIDDTHSENVSPFNTILVVVACSTCENDGSNLVFTRHVLMELSSVWRSRSWAPSNLFSFWRHTLFRMKSSTNCTKGVYHRIMRARGNFYESLTKIQMHGDAIDKQSSRVGNTCIGNYLFF